VKLSVLRRKQRSFRNLLRRRDTQGLRESLSLNLSRWGMRRVDYLLLRCRAPGEEIPAELPEVELSSLTPEDIPACAGIEGKSPDVFRRRLESGDAGIGIRLRGSLVGYAWLNRREAIIPEMNVSMPLEENAVYLYNGVIREDLRLRGLYGFFLLHLLRDETARGISVYAAVDPRNRKSLGTHLGAGFEPVGRLRQTRIGSKIVFGPTWPT